MSGTILASRQGMSDRPAVEVHAVTRKRKNEETDHRAQYERLKEDAVDKRLKSNADHRQVVSNFRKRKFDETQDPEVPPISLDRPFFDPESIPDDAFISVFGKRRTGKSFLVRWLLYLKRHRFRHGLVITKTKHNGYWQNYFPMNVVHGDYDPKIIENFLIYQLKLQEYNKHHPEKPLNTKAVIILDDIIADHYIRYCDALATLCYNGRHFDVMVIVCSQYVYGLPPGVRGNSDFVFTFTQGQKRQRKALTEDYGDKIYDEKFFLKMLDLNTQERNALVINLSDPNCDLDQMFFKFQAEEPPLFEIGSRKWKEEVWMEGERKIKLPYTDQ